MIPSTCKKCGGRTYLYAVHDQQSGEWWLRCEKCYTASPHAKTHDDAVEAWNKMQKEEQKNG